MAVATTTEKHKINFFYMTLQLISGLARVMRLIFRKIILAHATVIPLFLWNSTRPS